MDILNDPGFYGLIGVAVISFILLRILYPIRILRVVFGTLTYGAMAVVVVLLVIHFNVDIFATLDYFVNGETNG